MSLSRGYSAAHEHSRQMQIQHEACDSSAAGSLEHTLASLLRYTDSSGSSQAESWDFSRLGAMSSFSSVLCVASPPLYSVKGGKLF